MWYIYPTREMRLFLFFWLKSKTKQQQKQLLVLSFGNWRFRISDGQWRYPYDLRQLKALCWYSWSHWYTSKSLLSLSNTFSSASGEEEMEYLKCWLSYFHPSRNICIAGAHQFVLKREWCFINAKQFCICKNTTIVLGNSIIFS